MPPRNIETPVHLRPFVAHGLDVFKRTESEATGTCPFCGKDKFFVGLKDIDAKHFAGGWTCQVCGTGGNIGSFITRVWEESWSKGGGYDSLEERGVPPQHIRALGVCKSITTGEWIVPGYCGAGSIVNLYRWKPVGDGRYAMMATPGEGVVPLGYFREMSPPDDYDRVDVCEGVWDAAAWRWALSEADPDRLDKTLVIGVPGCNNFSESWARVCAGKVVTVMYDNDHPRVNEKTLVVTQPALAGVKKVVAALMASSDPPREVRYLCWGGDAAYHDEVIADGYDVRDVVRNSSDRSLVVGQVDLMVRPVPAEWASESSSSLPKSPPALRSTKCTSWGELLDAWKACDHLNDEFKQGLLFGMSIAAGVEYGECRVWGKLLGVPGTGKSTICDGLATARNHVLCDGTVNNLYSGAIREDGKDHSFAARLPGMCWIYNDADTLMENPNRGVIMSQLRELYGGTGSKVFNNGLGSRSYHNVKFSILMAGTPNVKKLDSSELGGRYLDFVFSRPPDATVDDMLMAAMRQQVSDDIGRSGMTKEKERATRMTGGYLEHLRKTVTNAAKAVRPNITNEQFVSIRSLAKYVAAARSRRPKEQDDIVDVREIPTRLVKQLIGLAVMAAVVKGKDRLDVGTMSFVRRVALDTSIGTVQTLIHTVARAGRVGIDVPSIVRITKRDPELDYQDVMYMASADILEMFSDAVSLSSRARWRLSASFEKVYRAVFPT